jgi:hypothetical protein
VLEDIPKPSCLCQVSGRNGGQFTAQGRWGRLALEAREGVFKAFGTAEQRARAASEFERNGFGFVEHRPNYGLTVSSIAWFAELFGPREDVTQVMFEERAWGAAQDVYGYVKSPIADQNSKISQ